MGVIDIFTRVGSELSGTFTAERAKLTWNDRGAALVQQLHVDYAQPIIRLYEVGSPHIYLVHGLVNGGAAANHLLGPTASMIGFYHTFWGRLREHGS
jgi:hypothetical protein